MLLHLTVTMDSLYIIGVGRHCQIFNTTLLKLFSCVCVCSCANMCACVFYLLCSTACRNCVSMGSGSGLLENEKIMRQELYSSSHSLIFKLGRLWFKGSLLAFSPYGHDTYLCHSQNESDNEKPKCSWASIHGCPGGISSDLSLSTNRMGQWLTVGVALPPLLPPTPLPLFPLHVFQIGATVGGRSKGCPVNYK